MSTSWAEVESGIYGNPELSDQLRFVATKKMRMYDLVTPADDFALGKNSGDTIGFKIAGPIAGTATTALSEFLPVPMATIPQYEVSFTVYQYGLAVPWTGLREDLDRITVEDMVMHALKEHSARTHNVLIANALTSGRSFCYSATGAATFTLTTNGTPSGTAAAGFSLYHARKIRLSLVKYNVPPADGENYAAVASPTVIDGLLGDASSANGGYVDVAKYSPGMADGILNGEVGTVQKIRIVEDNSNAISDAIGSGSAFGSMFVTGFDACREVMVYPMQILINTNLGGDFGRQKAAAWLSLLGFKTPWIYSTHGQGTVLHYTTA